MYKIAQISNNDRRVLFRNTAQKSRLHEAIVEKDYWVCLTLDCLFHQCSQQKAFTFKGGTSLSKCYGLIKRFSEDIDLILDWRILGYGQNEPWESRSASKQEKFNKEANRRTEEFLRKNLLPELTEKLSSKLKADASFYIDPNDPQTICFQYPKIFNTNSVLQIIRLEIGALAAWTPAKSKVIVPYAAEYYPDVFDRCGRKNVLGKSYNSS